jgi:hypothetical protein
MVNGFVSSRFKLVFSSINTEFQVVAFKGSEALDQPYFLSQPVDLEIRRCYQRGSSIFCYESPQ